jgi:hypothetical protein
MEDVPDPELFSVFCARTPYKRQGKLDHLRDRHHNMTGRVASAILLGLTIAFSLHLQGQENPVRSNPGAVVSVRFVGCNADGQVGPLPPPSGSKKEVQVPASIAKKLAYYKSEATSGVLAPRGWYCFGAYGSSGSALFVAPEPFKMDPDHPFAAISKGFTGPVIKIQMPVVRGAMVLPAFWPMLFPNRRDLWKACGRTYRTSLN